MELLVDLQQIGFIAGRNIVDNILAFWVGKEHVTKKKLRAMCIKYDFMKAYHRLDHAFLCDTLLAMGFSSFFVMLVRGLSCMRTLKVHANGLFSQEICLDRGMR